MPVMLYMTEPHPNPPQVGLNLKKVQLSIGAEGLIDSIIDYLKSALSGAFLSIALDGIRLKPPPSGFIQNKVIPWINAEILNGSIVGYLNFDFTRHFSFNSTGMGLPTNLPQVGLCKIGHKGRFLLEVLEGV